MFDPAQLRGAGDEAYRWATDLFPLNRSITGEGVRQTISYLKRLLPGLAPHNVPSGTQAFDWVVPKEWEITEAYIESANGKRIVDFADCNLHVVGYSTAVDAVLPLLELDPHLYSLPEQPNAIPYVTSYYDRRWGFCLSHRLRESLTAGNYRVLIRARHFDGCLDFADLLIPGETDQEILLSTYICHPSMANNELSGPVVTAALGRWLSALPRRRYTYRLVFVPETIGAIVYLSQHLDRLKAKLQAGFVVSCVGDDRTYSYIASRRGDTLSDRAALHALRHHVPAFDRYTFLDRASDERQYCSPGADLPVCSVLRSRHKYYGEYHTSLDDLTLISPAGLQGAINIYAKIFCLLENDLYWKTRQVGEPQLGRRGLYPTLSRLGSAESTRALRDFLAFADGSRDLIAICDEIGVDALSLLPHIAELHAGGVIATVEPEMPVASSPP
jgi:aminopeptidase-like protein